MTLDPREFLEKLVSIDTVNDAAKNKKATSECPELINSVLSERGFETELIESDGYYTSLGTRGEGSYSILFLAHFDVVPTGDGWDTDPFSLVVDGDIAYGRGTCDDKGNIVSMLLLADYVKDKELPCTLMLSASGDEEIGGRNGAEVLCKKLQDEDRFPNFIVIADGVKQQIIHRRRNILPTYIRVKSTSSMIKGKKETQRFETDTYGTKSRHSAYMRLGVDRHAMLAASKFLDLHPATTVSDIRGAFLKSNVVPDWVEMDVIHPDINGPEHAYDPALTDLIQSLLAINQASFPTRPSDKGTMIYPNLLSKDEDIWKLYCDIRAMTNDAEQVMKGFENAIRGKLTVESIDVHAGIGYVDSDPDSRLIRAARKALEEESIFYSIVEGFGGSDSRYFAGHGSDVFDFGPRGNNLHGPNEWVSLSSLEENARFFECLLQVLAE